MEKTSRTRKDIQDEISRKKELLNQLSLEILELKKENLLFSDDEQWFIERKEEHVTKRRPLQKETFLVGRVYWMQDFKDNDTGEIIPIERNQIVRINGEWKDSILIK